MAAGTREELVSGLVRVGEKELTGAVITEFRGYAHVSSPLGVFCAGA
jgi:hypothetical protein